MILRLRRFCYSSTETEGVLRLMEDGTEFATIEQPWRKNPNGALGGLPFHSCVPDGMYRLMPYDSPKRGPVYLLYNPDLGVHKFPQDHEKDHGRDLCEIHIANFAHEVEGCAGIGLERGLLGDEHGHLHRAVASSRAAMHQLIQKLGRRKVHILSIESALGASDQ